MSLIILFSHFFTSVDGITYREWAPGAKVCSFGNFYLYLTSEFCYLHLWYNHVDKCDKLLCWYYLSILSFTSWYRVLNWYLTGMLQHVMVWYAPILIHGKGAKLEPHLSHVSVYHALATRLLSTSTVWFAEVQAGL